MVQNKGLIFKSVPDGWPEPGRDLAVEDQGFDLDTEPPKDGITTKNYYASFDPYQRGRMAPPEKKSYFPPFELGKPITNSTIAKVLKSANSKFKEGDIVLGMIPTAEYSVIPAETIANGQMRKLENPYNLDPKLYLGALGMPGLTAYSSLYAIGEPKKGETIFISAASGAVGQVVGQLAKHEGLTVIGSVGSDEKLDFIKKDLKFDAGFNYKKEKPTQALTRLAPKGIDIYYENVGGEQLDAALDAMTNHGRIGKCSVPLYLLLTHGLGLIHLQWRAAWCPSTMPPLPRKDMASRTLATSFSSASRCKASLSAIRILGPSMLPSTTRTLPNGSTTEPSSRSRV